MIAELFPQNVVRPMPYRGDREVELTLDQEAYPEWDIDRAYDEALKKSAMVDRCVVGKAEKAGSLPLHVYDRGTSGDTEEGKIATDHELEILLNFPSLDEQGGREELVSRSFQHYDLAGNSLTGIVRARDINRGGERHPAELVSEDVREVYPVPGIVRGRKTLKRWNYRSSTGGTFAWDPADLIHWKRHNPANQFWGRSVLESLALTVSSSVEGARTHLLHMARDGRPGMIISDASITNADSGREKEAQLNARMRSRRGGIMLLAGSEGGQKLVSAGMSSSDLGILANLEFDRDMIAVAFNYLPAGFSTSAATYDNSRIFVLHEWSIVQAAMTAFCSRLTAFLIPRSDRRRFYIGADYSGVQALEEVAIDRLALLKDLSFKGASYNELVRGARLPLPTRSGGDVPLVPENVVPLAQVLSQEM